LIEDNLCQKVISSPLEVLPLFATCLACLAHRLVRHLGRTQLGRGHFWLISSHLDLFISNCVLLSMSVTSLFAQSLGRTQLGRGHKNTLILLRITLLTGIPCEFFVTPPKLDWWKTSSRTYPSCFPGSSVVR